MFKSWSKKKTVKAVFKMEFQATQVPKLKKSTLVISLVPEDVGKPTVRLERAAVQDGTCYWENPIYEKVKFIKDPKTGNLNEKIYHFIVSTGSSKSGYLGEASIDFTDFAAEAKPSAVSLPLKFANSGAVLHVTIQKMEEATDQNEEYRAPSLSHDKDLKNQPGNCSTDENLYIAVQDRHRNGTMSQISEQNGISRASTGSSATLASCWNTSSIQSTQQDPGLRSNSIHYEPTSLRTHIRRNSMPQKGILDSIITKNRVHRRSNTDCSMDSASYGSLVDSINSPEDNLPGEKLQEASDDSLKKLKNEIAALMRQAEVSEMELESLRRQIVKERKQGDTLSRNVFSLKEEKDALKIECEQLKSQLKRINEAEAPKTLQSEITGARVQLEATRQELNYEKNINKDLQLQLQKTQDSNTDLIHAVRDLEEMLERKNREITDLSTSKMNGDKNSTLEELAKEHDNSEEVDLLKQNIRDLNGEIEFYKKHKEELDMHMKQLVLDYELLKQENHDISLKLEKNQEQEQMTQNAYLAAMETIKGLESQIERLEGKFKKQTEEFSESLLSINELEIQVQNLETELEKQAEEFEENLNAMTCAKTEQEQRAIRAEEGLRKTRWNNAATAERLQEEFRRLSVEMASKFDEHEKQATKALTEAKELRLQKINLEELLEKANEELGLIKHQNEVKQQQLLNQIHLDENKIEKMSLELDQKSMQLEYAQKHDREDHEAFLMDIQMLRAEVERLTKEKYNFSEQVDREQIKTSVGEKEMLMQTWNKERGDLEKKLGSAKKETEKIHEELIAMRSLKDEKEAMSNDLQSEVEDLNARHNELKDVLDKEELEKENLRRQIFQIKNQLQKEEEMTGKEKKLMNCNGQSEERENAQENPLLSKMGATEDKSLQKEDIVVPHERRGDIHSEKEVKVSTFYAGDNNNYTNLLSEVALLKQRNKYMEKELKEMEERYSEISLKFAEVEGERQQLVMTVRNLKNGKKN
ncbi:myosin-J heavy chain [Juglans microcarpa x Juglans regia]|uniref:myosin-J heavy chain n=1 Tax=Juglans microcarpa x Juglans regia TaxID=2249226 RepID=UPI001B7DE457|nr:myosin-J heavy chain [Juglans microcarpa x Juglans regia]